MKTEIVIEENGQILSVSKSHRGRMHDFRIRKQEKFLPVDSIKYADSGYQGWQKLQKNVVIPYKNTVRSNRNCEFAARILTPFGLGFLTRFYQQLASRCFAGGLQLILAGFAYEEVTRKQEKYSPFLNNQILSWLLYQVLDKHNLEPLV